MGPHLISGFAALSRGTWWPGQPLGGESSSISTAAARPQRQGLGVIHKHDPDPGTPNLPLFYVLTWKPEGPGAPCSPLSPAGPCGKDGAEGLQNLSVFGFHPPQDFGQSRNHGGSQNPKAPTPRGPGSTEAPSPADLGWSFAQIWGGATTPDPPISSGFWPQVNKAATLTAGPGGPAAPVSPSLPGRPYGGEKTTAEHQARCCRPHSTLPAPVPQFPHPESAGSSGDCAAGATPR